MDALEATLPLRGCRREKKKKKEKVVDVYFHGVIGVTELNEAIFSLFFFFF